MKCYQCDKPAIYQIGKENIPLCLDCYFKFSQIQQQQIENNEMKWTLVLACHQRGQDFQHGRAPLS